MSETSDQCGSLEERTSALIELMRPAIQADGGDVEFVGITDERIVQVRFHGACIGCPSASITLQHGIQKRLQERIPEVAGVVAVE